MFEHIAGIYHKHSQCNLGNPHSILLLGGGFYFLIYSRLVPLRYFTHALKILTGKYDDPNEPGQLRHYQALSTALAGTVGMGNVSGVAVAITMGGPGAIFWMWVSALLGVSTKFFTCSLAVMFRGKDSNGEIQGGPMYFITEGLGKKLETGGRFLFHYGYDWCISAFSGQPAYTNDSRCNSGSQWYGR